MADKLADCPPETDSKGGKGPVIRVDGIEGLQREIGIPEDEIDGQFGPKSSQKLADFLKNNKLSPEGQKAVDDMVTKIGRGMLEQHKKDNECEVEQDGGTLLHSSPPTQKDEGPRARPAELAAKPDTDIGQKASPDTFGISVNPDAGGAPNASMNDFVVPKGAHGEPQLPGKEDFVLPESVVPKAAAPETNITHNPAYREKPDYITNKEQPSVREAIDQKNEGLTTPGLEAKGIDMDKVLRDLSEKSNQLKAAAPEDTAPKSPINPHIAAHGGLWGSTQHPLGQSGIDFNSAGGNTIGSFFEKLGDAFERAFSNLGAPLDNPGLAAKAESAPLADTPATRPTIVQAMGLNN